MLYGLEAPNVPGIINEEARSRILSLSGNALKIRFYHINPENLAFIKENDFTIYLRADAETSKYYDWIDPIKDIRELGYVGPIICELDNEPNNNNPTTDTDYIRERWLDWVKVCTLIRASYEDVFIVSPPMVPGDTDLLWYSVGEEYFQFFDFIGAHSYGEHGDYGIPTRFLNIKSSKPIMLSEVGDASIEASEDQRVERLINYRNYLLASNRIAGWFYFISGGMGWDRFVLSERAYERLKFEEGELMFEELKVVDFQVGPAYPGAVQEITVKLNRPFQGLATLFVHINAKPDGTAYTTDRLGLDEELYAKEDIDGNLQFKVPYPEFELDHEIYASVRISIMAPGDAAGWTKELYLTDIAIRPRTTEVIEAQVTGNEPLAEAASVVSWKIIPVRDDRNANVWRWWPRIREITESQWTWQPQERAECALVMLAIIKAESAGIPDRRGDPEKMSWGEIFYHSVGLFQMHDKGAGYGLSVAQREDPETQFAHMEKSLIPQFAKFWASGYKGWELATAVGHDGQRPAGYVYGWEYDKNHAGNKVAYAYGQAYEELKEQVVGYWF